jgi:hypothetical protein
VNIITLSPEQFYGLMKAMKKNPGVYNIRDWNNWNNYDTVR